MDHVLDAILEIFAWVGIGAGVLVVLFAVVLRVADGTWDPVHVVLEEGSGGLVARWFSDAGVGEASVAHDLARDLAGRHEADLYARRGSLDRVRGTRRSPAVRATAWLGAGLAALGVIALVASWILLFARG